MSSGSRLITLHRQEVKGAFWSRLNVVQTLGVLHGVETLWLILLFSINHVYETYMMGSGIFFHCILHLIFSLGATLSFIPGTFWIYLSMPFHIGKFLHPVVIYGLSISKMAIWFSEHIGTNGVALLKGYLVAGGTRGVFGVLMTLCLKIVLSFTVLWYHLVLERIRAENGTGCELKSAIELEMEAASKARNDSVEIKLEI